MTFDPDIARRRREDVVFAHLNHPLVAMSTELLRAAVTNSDSGLHRVTAVVSDDPQLETTLVVSYARLVIVGGDGVRLHEEVLHAGGWLRTRFARVESFARLDTLLSDALGVGEAAPPHIRQQLASAWPTARDPLFASLKRRAGDRQQSLEARLKDRHADERNRFVANLDRFAKELRRAIADSEDTDSEFVQLTLELDEIERQQAQRDLIAWRRRLDALPAERDAQLERLARRYAEPKAHLFPVAVAFVVPRREVIA